MGAILSSIISLAAPVLSSVTLLYPVCQTFKLKKYHLTLLLVTSIVLQLVSFVVYKAHYFLILFFLLKKFLSSLTLGVGLGNFSSRRPGLSKKFFFVLDLLKEDLTGHVILKNLI